MPILFNATERHQPRTRDEERNEDGNENENTVCTMIHMNDSQTIWHQLRRSSRKRSGGVYTRYVNRNAAMPLTWLLWKAGLAPNAVSLISFCLTHAALVILIAMGTTSTAAVIGYLLLVLGYVLDSCDGQLARVSGRTSKLGGWLDHSFDMVKLINLNLTLGYVMISTAIEMEAALALPFTAAGLNLLSQPAHYFVVCMKCQMFESSGASHDAATGGADGDGRAGFDVRRLAVLPILFMADYGIFIMIVLLLPWQELFVPIYFGYGVFSLMLMAAHFAKTSLAVAARS